MSLITPYQSTNVIDCVSSLIIGDSTSNNLSVYTNNTGGHVKIIAEAHCYNVPAATNNLLRGYLYLNGSNEEVLAQWLNTTENYITPQLTPDHYRLLPLGTVPATSPVSFDPSSQFISPILIAPGGEFRWQTSDSLTSSHEILTVVTAYKPSVNSFAGLY